MPRGSVIAGTSSDELGDAMPGIMVRLMRYQYAQGRASSCRPAAGRPTIAASIASGG